MRSYAQLSKLQALLTTGWLEVMDITYAFSVRLPCMAKLKVKLYGQTLRHVT